MDESDPIGSVLEDRKNAVAADTATAITEPDHQVGIFRESLRPGADAEQKIIARSLDLDQTRSHGTDPRAAMQVEVSLSLPAASMAVTPYVEFPGGGALSSNWADPRSAARTVGFLPLGPR